LISVAERKTFVKKECPGEISGALTSLPFGHLPYYGRQRRKTSAPQNCLPQRTIYFASLIKGGAAIAAVGSLALLNPLPSGVPLVKGDKREIPLHRREQYILPPLSREVPR
jgi:hypothetical protein